jgi:hypothetical protein
MTRLMRKIWAWLCGGHARPLAGFALIECPGCGHTNLAADSHCSVCRRSLQTRRIEDARY